MDPLDTLSSELALVPDLWWGMSSNFGWIVLDRADPRTEGDPRRFVVCADWSAVNIPRSVAGTVQCRWFRNYINSITDTTIRSAACDELTRLAREFVSRLGEFRITKANWEQQNRESELLERHDAYLQRVGVSSLGARRTNRPHRETHCFCGHAHLDSSINSECMRCGLLICHACGGCFCGRSKPT